MRVQAAVAALLSLTPAVAWAQTPTITITSLPASAEELNIQEVNENADITLTWSAVVPSSNYRYRLTIDRTETEQNTTAATVLSVDEDDDAVDGSNSEYSGVTMSVTTRPQLFIPSADLPGSSTDGANKTTLTIVLKVYEKNNELDSDYYATASWQLSYDTRPPEPPTITGLVAGENRLGVQWSDSSSSDVDNMDIFYCPDVSDVDTSSISKLPCDSPNKVSGISDVNEYSISDDLQVDVPAAVSMRSIDEFGNVGEMGNIMVGTPIVVDDFMERYRAEGGQEDGGYCFIATAAYGSYAHPVVKVLRLFRDWVLAPTPPGAAFIRWYYANSPPWARWLQAHEGARSVVRLMLLPVGLAALLIMSAPIWGLLFIWFFFRRRARRALGAAAVLLCLLAAPSAEAERPRSQYSAVGLGFEFRIGSYLMKMAESAADGGNQTFTSIFGEDQKRPLMQVGMEIQVFRGFGSAAIGGSVGYTRWSGYGLLPGGSTKSNDVNRLYLIPFTLTGIYRFDVLADRTPVPLVPYGRFGLAYDLWWQTNGVDNITRFENDAGDRVAARGGKFGLTGAIGVSFLLNAVDDGSARKLSESTGIRGSYLFVEYSMNWINGFGADGFDFSDNMWNIGLFFEM